MKAITIRAVSLVLIVAMLLVNCPTKAMASENTVHIISEETVLEIGDTRIEFLAISNEDTILLQYVNNVLTQANVINVNNPNLILRYKYDPSTDTWAELSSLTTTDYVTSYTEPEASTCATETGFTTFGIIYYTVEEGFGSTSYRQKVECSTRERTSTYRVNSFRGAVIDLVSLLAGALTIPVAIMSPYVTALLTSLGVTVVAGVITEFLSPTLACTHTTYTWRLTILETGASITNVTGDMYYITHEESPYTNRTYYEKYTPQDWGTSLMAQTFFCQQFMNLYWSVDRWERV